MKKNMVGGYFVGGGSIISMYTEVEVADGKLPENFIVSENVNDKVLRISADGKKIEVVEESIRDLMKSRRQKNEAAS